MKLNDLQKAQSISNINNFIAKFKKIRTVGLLCRIDYFKDGKIYLSHTCNCCVYFNSAFSQLELQIDWTYEKSTLKKHKLRETYNTNFHIFQIEEATLKIIDNMNILTVEILNEGENEINE